MFSLNEHTIVPELGAIITNDQDFLLVFFINHVTLMKVGNVVVLAFIRGLLNIRHGDNLRYLKKQEKNLYSLEPARHPTQAVKSLCSLKTIS